MAGPGSMSCACSQSGNRVPDTDADVAEIEATVSVAGVMARGRQCRACEVLAGDGKLA